MINISRKSKIKILNIYFFQHGVKKDIYHEMKLQECDCNFSTRLISVR